MQEEAARIFSFQEAAIAYAKAAERILGPDIRFLEKNPELVPVLVTLLFQSLEISLKHLGIEAELLTEREARNKKLKNGHGVKEIAELVNAKLDANNDYPVINVLTVRSKNKTDASLIQKMLFGSEFEATRTSYERRNLGYLSVNQGDFAIVEGLKPWVLAVRQVAENLTAAVNIVKQWKSSPSGSKHFAIRFNNH